MTVGGVENRKDPKTEGAVSRRLLLAMNSPCDPLIKETLERSLDATVDVIYINSIGKKALNAWRRHLTYMVLAFRALRNRRRYHVIFFWQQFIAFYYALFAGFILFQRRFPPSLAGCVMYKKRAGWTGKVYRKFWRMMFASPVLTRFTCHASGERDYLAEEVDASCREKVVFVRYGIKLPDTSVKPQEGIDVPAEKRYFFAGGASNRDYALLVKVFRKLPYRLKIACGPANVAGLAIPENVDVIHGAYGQDFDRLIRGAYMVIIPIKDPNFSSGQMVLFEAMRLAKATIVTSGRCTADYVQPSYAMLVPPQNEEALRKAVTESVDGPDRVREMAAAAYQAYSANYTFPLYIERLAAVLKQL